MATDDNNRTREIFDADAGDEGQVKYWGFPDMVTQQDSITELWLGGYGALTQKFSDGD